jgi:hypothetical protein
MNTFLMKNPMMKQYRQQSNCFSIMPSQPPYLYQELHQVLTSSTALREQVNQTIIITSSSLRVIIALTPQDPSIIQSVLIFNSYVKMLHHRHDYIAMAKRVISGFLELPH